MPDISAIQSAVNVLNGLPASGTASATAQTGASFQDMFTTALNNLTETTSDSSAYNDALLMGESDNLHDPMIAATEAELSVSLVVQIRDKVVDAYSELMRMQV